MQRWVAPLYFTSFLFVFHKNTYTVKTHCHLSIDTPGGEVKKGVFVKVHYRRAMAADHIVRGDLQCGHRYQLRSHAEHDGAAHLVRVGELRVAGDADASLEDRLPSLRCVSRGGGGGVVVMVMIAVAVVIVVVVKEVFVIDILCKVQSSSDAKT